MRIFISSQHNPTVNGPCSPQLSENDSWNIETDSYKEKVNKSRLRFDGFVLAQGRYSAPMHPARMYALAVRV